MKYVCMSLVDNYGNMCPGSCPIKCGEDEGVCPGGKDQNGCHNPDFSQPPGPSN